MLEILLIVVLSKRISSIVKSKGYKGVWFVVMFIVLWFAGEIAGGMVGAIIGMISTGGREEPPMLIIYVCALVGAAAGAGTAFVIVNLMAPAWPTEDEHELEEWDGYRPAPSLPPKLKDEGQYFDPEARRHSPGIGPGKHET
jgi:hypothetical protein